MKIVKLIELIENKRNKFLTGAALILLIIIAIPCVFVYKSKLDRKVLEKLIPADNYYQEGKYHKAVLTYQEIIEKYPRSSHIAQALFYKGNCHYNLKEYDEALSSYQNCLKRFSRNPRALSILMGIGYSHEEKGDFQEAIESYQRIIDKYPQSYLVSQALLNRGRCSEGLDDWEKAGECYQKILDFHPNSPWKESAQARIDWLKANSKIEEDG